MEKFSIQQYIQLYIVKRNVQTFFLDGARSLEQTIFFSSLSLNFFSPRRANWMSYIYIYIFFPVSDITKTKKFYLMSFTC